MKKFLKLENYGYHSKVLASRDDLSEAVKNYIHRSHYNSENELIKWFDNYLNYEEQREIKILGHINIKHKKKK